MSGILNLIIWEIGWLRKRKEREWWEGGGREVVRQTGRDRMREKEI